MRPFVCTLLVGGAALVAACGGGGGDDGGKNASAEAEKTVRDYLTALVDKNGGAACAKLTPEYQKSVLEQNAAFAEQQKADTCAKLVDAVTESAPSVSFEGDILNKDNVGKVGLDVAVTGEGDAQKAVVTGTAKIQRYALETRDGRWLIAKIERVDNPPSD